VGPLGPPRGSIAITADDGYASHAAHFHPLLRELGVPWTVFVLAGAVGRSNHWDLGGVGIGERHLTTEEIRRLAGEGVTIGSHGMSHRTMTDLPDEALEEELVRSREILRCLSDQGVDAVAYPRGRTDARVAAAARRAGYRLGFALGTAGDGARGADSALRLPRTALYAPDQIPGLFEATALRAPRALRALRTALQRLGGGLVTAALTARERSDG